MVSELVGARNGWSAMTTSRLYLAAAALEAAPCQKDDIGGTCPCMIYFHTARLLRAIAPLARTAIGKGEFGTPYTVCIECDSHDGHDADCIVAAAEALADLILERK